MKLAQEEINNITLQLADSMEAQQKLQEVVKNLEEDLNDLNKRNYELEIQGKYLKEVEKRVI